MPIADLFMLTETIKNIRIRKVNVIVARVELWHSSMSILFCWTLNILVNGSQWIYI